ncbi:lysine--tRNA ligase [Senegalia massiliensis]|uniref:lysine--tRNA ligase n=1 Tax=Senegalia massiliensis TaxID=1720316 RepID=UPI001032301D|nr:lysine--tRNA ligase [Senegalia massiliensis]
MNNIFESRLIRRNNWKDRECGLYPNQFEKSHSAKDLNSFNADERVSFAGRISKIRNLGKIAFMDIKDYSGMFQVSFTVDDLGDKEYKFYLNNLDTGDIIGVMGEIYSTKGNQKTLRVEECYLLSKALRIVPSSYEKFNSAELCVRQRYLDLLVNDDTRKRFELRSKMISLIRKYLDEEHFMEVETPILQPVAIGAAARPFKTYHNSLDIPLFLRIGHEPYLKRLMVGGYERIYEIGKCFRNEGIDPSRLQEFTLLEYYVAYWNYKDNMKFMQKMLQEIIIKLMGSTKVTYQGIEIDFAGEWPEVTFRELLIKYVDIDIDEVTTYEELVSDIQKKNLDIEYDKYFTYSSLLDALYKKYSRIHVIQPTFVTEYPTELVCLSRTCDDNPKRLELFQLIVNSWELIKAYSELVDPIEQKERFEEQKKMREAGDEVASEADEEYVLCMEYGMPIMSGIGLGIDRLLAILTNVTNIRDTIYFPPVKPMRRSELE